MTPYRDDGVVKEKGPSKDKTDALGRQVWDKEYFSKKAQERVALDDDDDDIGVEAKHKESLKRKREAIPPPSERKPLQERSVVLPLDVELGKSKVVTTHTLKQHQGGFWCDVCDCLIKDSQAYLDHINGRRHNRLLGMTMRVERVGVSKVKERLEQLKQESAQQREIQKGDEDGLLLQAIESRIAEANEAEQKKKKERKEKRKKRRKQQRDRSPS